MPTFNPPNDKMTSAFEYARGLEEHHDRLKTVNLQLISAVASVDKDGEPRGEALTRGGRVVLTAMRILSLEERSAAKQRGEVPFDARIILNGDLWGSTPTAMQRAALDQCLTSISVIESDDGTPVLDDAGRPKLRKRRPDYVLDGFFEVAERHGQHSLEVHEIRTTINRKFNEVGQTLMPWITDGSPLDADIFATRERPAKSANGADKKKAQVNGYQLGSLKPKPLRDRINMLERAETILGIAALEFASAKPRPGVLASLAEKAREFGIIEDLRSVETGATPRVTPDLAAAVLVTSPANIGPDVLEQLVPECRDATVLEWVMDDEQNRDDRGRDYVVEVVQGRLDYIRDGGDIGANAVH